jgi:hypothetical protein
MRRELLFALEKAAPIRPVSFFRKTDRKTRFVALPAPEPVAH